MTIRGGGNPHSAMAAMPLREWTRRLGALPAEAYDCFMVGTPYGFSRIQAWFARLIAPDGKLPSDHRPDHNQRGRRARTCQGAAWKRRSVRARAERRPTLTGPVRVGLNMCGSGRRNGIPSRTKKLE